MKVISVFKWVLIKRKPGNFFKRYPPFEFSGVKCFGLVIWSGFFIILRLVCFVALVFDTLSTFLNYGFGYGLQPTCKKLSFGIVKTSIS
jgi:hypothetical protein